MGTRLSPIKRHRANELAATLFEEAGDALFLVDTETEQPVDVNAMARRLSGFDRSELSGQYVTDLFRSEVAGGLQQLRLAYRKTGLFHSREGYWLRHRQHGVWVPVKLTATRLRAGPRVLGLITARDLREQRKVHDQLRETETELHRVLSSVSDYVWSGEIDAAGHWTYHYYSPVVERITGRPPAFYLPGPECWLSTVHAEDRPWIEQEFIRLQTKQVSQLETEHRIDLPDGSVRWVRNSVRVGPGKEEGGLRLDGVVTDITARKHAEELLRQSEERLRELHCRYTRVGPAEMELLGSVNQSQAIGRRVFDFYPEPLARAYYPNEQQIVHPGQALTDKVEGQTGDDANQRWLSSAEVPIRGPDGTITGIVGVSRDINGQQRAAEAVRASEAKYRTLIENLEQDIFFKDSDLRYLAANRHFCERVGLSEKELVGKSDFDIHPRQLAEKYQADDLRVLAEGTRLELEEENCCRGQLQTLRVVKTPVKDARGRNVAVLGISWDVTEQRALEAQLRQAQKMEAVGQLAGGVAHDFNNFLTVILGNLSTLQAEMSASPAHRELLCATEKAALRAADLTSTMLGFSRRSTSRLAPVNLSTLVEEALVLLRCSMEPRIRIEFTPPPDLWLVQVDPGQINQILMNLCLNARDAMPDGGCLTLETANVCLTEEARRLSREAHPGKYVRLRVQDTGLGMGPAVVPHIFEPFFTTKAPGKGTGLGLAMVRGIVKQHRGWIECASQLGLGTNFDVYLPRFEPTREAAPPIPRAQLSRAGKETILLVDDEPMIRNLGRAILQGFGYRVLLAEDGRQALEAYAEHQRGIDLVILDVSMPHMSGRDTLRELVRLDPQARVVLTSGFSAEDLDESEKAGIVGFISKPYRPEELARGVRASLNSGATWSPSAR
jgi:PAS domain S-box-containing protein